MRMSINISMQDIVLRVCSTTCLATRTHRRGVRKVNPHSRRLAIRMQTPINVRLATKASATLACDLFHHHAFTFKKTIHCQRPRGRHLCHFLHVLEHWRVQGRFAVQRQDILSIEKGPCDVGGSLIHVYVFDWLLQWEVQKCIGCIGHWDHTWNGPVESEGDG